MNTRRRIRFALLAFLPATAWSAQDIASTVHNLSTSGTGTFKSLTVSEVCVFCHTPHSGEPETPLWNRSLSGQTYLTYSSSTLQASPGQPSGRSRLCLSCHDGTVALGAIRNLPGAEKADLSATFLTGRAALGTDLHDDHPISFRFDNALANADAELASPASIRPFGLSLEDGLVQCTSCHDPHERDIRPFLRIATSKGQLCTTCHRRGGGTWNWGQSSHATSPATWRGGGVDPWGERKDEWRGSDVAENACFNCHKPHTAPDPEGLLKNTEENTCFACHTGTVAAKDIRAEFFKPFRHPVEITPNADHTAMLAENPLRMNLHAECMDCHNPHAARGDVPMVSFNPANPAAPHAAPPAANGRIAGVTGIGLSGGVRKEIEFQYELCFKCHGVPGLSACGAQRCPTPRSFQMARVDGVFNLRDKVNPTNPRLVSFHPLVENNPANNAEVPSLRADVPLDRVRSRIYCTDCHNSDASPAAGNTGGPTGPHGSILGAILTLRYTFDPIFPGFVAAGQAELCFKCHSRASLEADESGFLHEDHFDEGRTCINCHDPHGSHRFPHLLNFQTRSVFGGRTLLITGAGRFAVPTFIDGGRFRGTCFLNCHGEVHAPRCYDNGVGREGDDCPVN